MIRSVITSIALLLEKVTKPQLKGSVSMPSISVTKGSGSINHNLRKFSTPNVDPTRSKNNIVYKVQPLEAAYQECFEKAIDDYNAKQKRKDRQIDGIEGYMNQIKNSGNGEQLFYEIVVQIGNMHDCHVGSSQGMSCVWALEQYMQEFQKNNPNLHVFNAVMHLDEQTPHLHIDYIPVAKGYKKGLEARNSLSRALFQQGDEAKGTRLDNSSLSWQNRQKNELEKCMNNFNLSRSEEKELKHEHLSVNQYKAIASEIENSIKKIPDSVTIKPKFLDKENVTVSKKDLENLEERAKLSQIHEESYKNIVEDITSYRDHAAELSTTLEQHQKVLEENQRLKAENQSLISGIYEYQEKIADLKWDNEVLRSKIRNLQQVLAEVFMALDTIRNGFEELRSTLTEKQSNLFRAVENFVVEHLSDRKDNLVHKVRSECGISNRIKEHIKNLDQPKEKVVRSHRTLIK